MLEWDNFFYEEDIQSVHDIEKTLIRIGVVQWQMRAMNDLEDLLDQAEFFYLLSGQLQSRLRFISRVLQRSVDGIAKRSKLG